MTITEGTSTIAFTQTEITDTKGSIPLRHLTRIHRIENTQLRLLIALRLLTVVRIEDTETKRALAQLNSDGNQRWSA